MVKGLTDINPRHRWRRDAPPAQGSPASAVSYWSVAAGLGRYPRRPLEGAVDADVCVVGGGYTGLWSAWALLVEDPSLRIAIVESQHAGFGASGRNGGWLSGLVPGDRDRLARGPGGAACVIALQRRLAEAVAGVAEVAGEEGIDADLCLGGTLAVATTRSQLERLREGLRQDRRYGLGPEDTQELGPSETARRVRVAGAVGSVFNAHCARVQPAKLIAGLVRAAERRGAALYERSPAVRIELCPARSGSQRVITPRGSVRAAWVVRATEGYTASMPGMRRALLPMNSSMIITDPLDPQAWSEIGLDGMQTLRDAAHVYVYLQRTVDGRIGVGGRGVPYRYGSHLGAAGRTPASTVVALEAALRRLFPPAAHARAVHAWSGVLGVARDWCPSVSVECAGDGGVVSAGGYAGDGVAASYLAGRTVADLVLGRQTERTALPWVGHRSRPWEPEPLRWMGVRGVYALYRAADRAERRRADSPRTSPLAAIADFISAKP